MSKFKVEPGDFVDIRGLKKEQIYEIIKAFEDAGGVNRGDIFPDKAYLMLDIRDCEVWTYDDTKSYGMKRQIKASDLLGYCSTWHPHHDVIVAWAKGADICGRPEGTKKWKGKFNAKDDAPPSWRIDWEYEVIPEPDNTAEIAEIEQEMLKLADRLEKLK